MADTHGLGPCALKKRGGSNPLFGTKGSTFCEAEG